MKKLLFIPLIFLFNICFSQDQVVLFGDGSFGGNWGTIGGTLSNQTDLQNALNLKLNISDSLVKYVTPTQLASFVGAGAWIVATRHGAKGDGTTDDHDSLQAMISTAPHGAVVYLPNVISASNPNGYYLIGKSLIDTNEVRIIGASSRGAVLFATSGFVGYFLIRNWTDAQSATDSMPSAPPYYAYPDIENLGFAMGGGLTNVSFMGIANFQESSYIGHIIMSPSSDCVRTRGICITGINAGIIQDITCYGSTTTAPWGSELYIPGIGSGSFAGGSLYIDGWVSSQNSHSESPFYIKGASDVQFLHPHIEATAGNVADAAIFRLVNSTGFSLKDGTITVHSAGTSRPAIRSTNTSGTGNSVTSPIIENMQISGRSYMTGNIIEDSSQNGNAYVISPTAYPVDYIQLYNGQEFDINDNTSPNYSLPKHYNLHAGLINFEGWASTAPTSGSYVVGDIIHNSNPISDSISSWYCVSSTPLTTVAFVSSSSNTASAQTVVVTAPTGIANNDILFAIVMNSAAGTPGTPSFPAGFTNLGVTYASGNYKFNVGWKRASSESGNYTFDGASGCTNISAAISVYRNCISVGDPTFVNHSSSDYTTNDLIIKAATGITPTSSGMYLWMGFAQASAETITTPAGITQRENPALINNSRIFIGDESYTIGSGTIGPTSGALGVSTAVKRADAFVLLGQGAAFMASKIQ